MENVSLMEFLIHYGVNFVGQPRDLLLQQATIAPEDASLLDSMWSSVCVCGVRDDNEKRKFYGFICAMLISYFMCLSTVAMAHEFCFFVLFLL